MFNITLAANVYSQLKSCYVIGVLKKVQKTFTNLGFDVRKVSSQFCIICDNFKI